MARAAPSHPESRSAAIATIAEKTGVPVVTIELGADIENLDFVTVLLYDDVDG